MGAGPDGEDPDDLDPDLDPGIDLLRVLGWSFGFRHFGFRGRLSTPCCHLSTPYSLGLHDIHRGLL